MKADLNINVRHLSRVEGHGNIRISVKDGKLVDARWEVVETPRFFEAMLRGLSHEMAPLLTSRICGICSIAHSIASLRSIERAMKIEVPDTAAKVRLLAKHGETLQSHVLHLLFLAVPDFVEETSIVPLIHAKRPEVEAALRLKKLGNEICAAAAGRATHPVSFCVGGIGRAPDKMRLRSLRKEILSALGDLHQVVGLFKRFRMPAFVRETEFVSLKGERNYPWIDGSLVSSDGVLKDQDEYLSMTNEYGEDYSTSKFTRLSREAFAVGALARVNNNYRLLKAKDVAEEFSLASPSHNPFMNNIAQLVECVHVTLEMRELLDELLDDGMKSIRADYEVREGEGVGAVEAPRGILYHRYSIDDKGVIAGADCVIPTTQNNGNIHHDLAALVEQEAANGKSDSQVTKLCEMLVRAYDPCISCSVH
jgi:sulfhydrogenase subunit alpha